MPRGSACPLGPVQRAWTALSGVPAVCSLLPETETAFLISASHWLSQTCLANWQGIGVLRTVLGINITKTPDLIYQGARGLGRRVGGGRGVAGKGADSGAEYLGWSCTM